MAYECAMNKLNALGLPVREPQVYLSPRAVEVVT